MGELSSMGWVAVGSILLVAWVAARVVEWAWWRPRRLERALRSLGIGGTRYRFFVGDLEDDRRQLREAQAKPISPLSHRIVPRLAPFLLNVVNRYGKMSVTWFGPTPRVTIMDPDLIREILTNRYNQFGRIKANPLALFLTTGLSTMDGEKWAKHRRIVSPAFHLEKLKCMFPAFSICCDELISKWEKLAGPEGSFELDVWQGFQSFTGNVISRAAFGNCYEEGQRIFLLQAEQAELLLQAVRGLYIPGFRFLPTKKNNRRREIYREVRGIISSMIKQRENDLGEGRSSNDDLLGLLMEANPRRSKGDADSKNIELTTDQVIEECKLFYFSGQETTSSLLTWTMVALSMHPSWQERAREEVLQVFGKNNPDFNDLNGLKILTMILYEVLRLYPPGTVLGRSTYKNVKLGDITLPPGVQLVLPVLLVHHDPELWGEDVTEFRPDRFAAGVSKASKNQAAFFPFGGGQRVCIGQNFALYEAKMCLATILQHFSFEVSQSYTHAPRQIITLQPQYGAQIILHKL